MEILIDLQKDSEKSASGVLMMRRSGQNNLLLLAIGNGSRIEREVTVRLDELLAAANAIASTDE